MHSTKRARELRRQSTTVERLLWAQLRHRRPGGHKFRRQYPVGPYVADFICFEARLIVEADGASHDLTEEYDMCRDRWFRAKGFRVYRVRNEDVQSDLEGVVATICQLCETG